MRTTILLIGLISISLPGSFGQATENVILADPIMTLNGVYNGKNLYIQNPYSSSNVSFCWYKTTVNGMVPPDAPGSSAFEVDFTLFQLEIGDSVEVKIYHRSDCLPKILNPEVLEPRSTFVIVSINVDTSGVLHWRTTDESGPLSYTIEQFRWNKWVKIDEIEGQGLKEGNEYTFQIRGHSGTNQIGVKQVDYTRVPRRSASVYWLSNVSEVSFTPKVVKKQVTFSAETIYEIYDAYGNIVKKGYSGKVDCSNLKKGTYYMNYDNKELEKFEKK